MGNSNQTLNQQEISKVSEQIGMSREQVEQMYDSFIQLDQDGKGHVSKEDFMSVLKRVNGNEQVSDQICSYLDSREDGSVDFMQLIKSLISKKLEK